MPKKSVYEKRLLEKQFKFCQAVRAGDFLFISGCLSWDGEGAALAVGDWPGQIRNVYGELKATLERFGLGFSNVVKETVYCRSIEAMSGAASARAEMLGDNEPFAATWVEVGRLIHPDLLLEVEMTAVFRD